MAESGSSRNPQGIENVPIVPLASCSGIADSHGATVTWCSVVPGIAMTSAQNALIDSASDAAMVEQATRPETRLLK